MSEREDNTDNTVRRGRMMWLERETQKVAAGLSSDVLEQFGREGFNGFDGSLLSVWH